MESLQGGPEPLTCGAGAGDKRRGTPDRAVEKGRRGLSLAELIVGLGLFAIVIIPIFGIIPTAYMSIKKAEDYSAASCYAQEVIEIYKVTNPSLTESYVTNGWDVVLNGTEYHVAVGLYGIDYNNPYRVVDVVVNMYWKKIPEKINVFTRVFYNE